MSSAFLFCKYNTCNWKCVYILNIKVKRKRHTFVKYFIHIKHIDFHCIRTHRRIQFTYALNGTILTHLKVCYKILCIRQMKIRKTLCTSTFLQTWMGFCSRLSKETNANEKRQSVNFWKMKHRFDFYASKSV